MTEYEILKKEEILCHTIWASKSMEATEEGCQYTPLQHMHMCDFDILYFLRCKNRRQLDKLVEKKCKEYLASIGKERDEYMCCCDECIHDRYLTISEETEDLILNIATLGLDERMKTLEGDINGEDTDCKN